jgi:histidine triad (HIT) family protein
MMTLAIKAGGIMQNIVFPQGYNMLMNLGKVAGQTIPHIHMHLIPRFEGDGLRNLGRENQASPRPEITQEAIEKIKRYFPPVMRHEQ